MYENLSIYECYLFIPKSLIEIGLLEKLLGLFGKKNFENKDFRNKDLSWDDLIGANFAGVDLSGANLNNANLTGANLTDANLSNANLTGANLHDANLSSANLSHANLTDAYLYGANLTGANLTDANLIGAELSHANLHGAILTDTKVNETNEKFGIKQFDFNEGLESVIEVSYGMPRESKVKLFFSTDDFTTFSRNYTEKLTDNFVRLIIAPSTRVNALGISGGNYDFNMSDDKGYSLFVSMRREDSKLLAVISNVLRSENFGCLPSRFTITAHRDDKFPTEHTAVEILDKLNYKIANAILEMKN